MNEKKGVIVVCLFLGIMLSLSLVSASAFSDFYDKLTGKATVVSGECTDSDGGINYYTPGKIVSSEGIKGGDYCSFGNLLVEQYCESSERINAYVYDCADEGKVCKDGACVVEETQCTDSDGGRDYYESGVARTYDGIHDYAIDSAGESCSGNSVIESYCINGDLQVKQEFYDCATEGKICQKKFTILFSCDALKCMLCHLQFPYCLFQFLKQPLLYGGHCSSKLLWLRFLP